MRSVTVASFTPTPRDYTDIYASYGLLHSKTLLGHCIHLSERERDVLSGNGRGGCALSNIKPVSRFRSFSLEELSKRRRPVRTGVATDVGAGTSFSMLRTMDEAYKIQQLLGARLNPLKSFHDMTLGNAMCLGCNDRIGTLAVGRDADLVVLDASATSLMALRMAKVSSLAEELFMPRRSATIAPSLRPILPETRPRHRDLYQRAVLRRRSLKARPC